VRMVVEDGGRLALAGVIVGTALAAAGARLIRGLLFDVSAGDPITFIAAPLTLFAVALIASYVPARRATRIAPNEVLRF
jgi:putative ABC transport system permease protein